RRILNEGGETVESRATHGFQLALSRSPSADELKRLVSLFELPRAALAREPANAGALATTPLGPLQAQVDPVDAAAWSVVGNVLLNLDEFLAKR
ncbi:MAG: hypothetical protein NT069_07500, partial [Planctomycetota bacterium]|nr:hypothetical protein [Planctomycetota bacterium]